MFSKKKYIWYIVSQDGKPIDAKKKPNISYQEVEIEFPIKLKGTAVKATNKSEALKILGIPDSQQNEYFEAFTDLEELQILATPPFVFVESEDNLQALSTILPILQDYSKIMQTGISIRNWHNCDKAPDARDDNWLHVWFYIAPTNSKKTIMYSAFGYALDDDQNDAKTMSGKGKPIKDHTGQVVAEVINKCIYILFDLPHSRQNSAEILTHILEQYYMDNVLLESKKAARIVEFHKEQAKRYSLIYGKFCLERHTKVIDKHRRTQEELDDKVEQLTKYLVQTTRKQYENSVVLKALEKQPVPVPEEYVSDLNALMKDVAVDHIVVTQDSLLVWTKELQDEDTGISIGSYLIQIPFDGGRISAKNTKSLEIDRNWCLGDIHEAMAQLTADYQFAMAALYMIEYLRQNVRRMA